jgi:hypothetical protein
MRQTSRERDPRSYRVGEAEVQGYGQDRDCVEGGADAISIGPEPAKDQAQTLFG